MPYSRKVSSTADLGASSLVGEYSQIEFILTHPTSFQYKSRGDFFLPSIENFMHSRWLISLLAFNPVLL